MGDSRLPANACSGCGLVVPDGIEGCRRIFEELLARDFSDAKYFRVHRMMVDTYALQHPEAYCASGKSLVAHLAGLHGILAHGDSRATGSQALRQWLDGNRHIHRPDLPSSRGRVTVMSVREASGPAAHAGAVERWARSTWEAYASLHPFAEECARQALRSKTARPR